MKRQEKQPQPQPQYQFQTYDQQYLYAILSELRLLRQTVDRMHTTIQIVVGIMILSVIGFVVLVLLGPIL